MKKEKPISPNPRNKSLYQQGNNNANGYVGNVSQEPKGYNERQERLRSFLPDPEVLENYNYVVEGSAEKIIKMLEDEQKHRHGWENRSLQMHTSCHMLGIIASLFFSVCLVMSVTVLGLKGYFTLAVILAALGFGATAFALQVNSKVKRFKDDAVVNRHKYKRHRFNNREPQK